MSRDILKSEVAKLVLDQLDTVKVKLERDPLVAERVEIHPVSGTEALVYVKKNGQMSRAFKVKISEVM